MGKINTLPYLQRKAVGYWGLFAGTDLELAHRKLALGTKEELFDVRMELCEPLIFLSVGEVHVLIRARAYYVVFWIIHIRTLPSNSPSGLFHSPRETM